MCTTIEVKLEISRVNNYFRPGFSGIAFQRLHLFEDEKDFSVATGRGGEDLDDDGVYLYDFCNFFLSFFSKK